MRKYIFFTLLFLSPIISLIPYVLSDTSDYKLGIKEDYGYVWEYTHVDDNLTMYLYNYAKGYDYSITENEKGDQIRYDIDSISDYDSYWQINFDYYKGKNLDKDKYNYDDTDYLYLNICADPKLLADDWFVDKSYNYSLIFVPKDVENFLKEFYSNIPAVNKTVFYVDGTSFIMNFTKIGQHDTIVIEYNSDGTQKSHSIYYDGKLALKYELVWSGYSGIDLETIIIIIIIAICILSCVVGLVVKARAETKVKTDISKISHPTPIAAPIDSSAEEFQLEPKTAPVKPQILHPVLEEPKTVGYCEYCGYERESDAIYCPICGQKFRKE
ncbi:MAG: hypothetical protein ACTSVV_10590 [Promethearchaeota archaeon]